MEWNRNTDSGEYLRENMSKLNNIDLIIKFSRAVYPTLIEEKALETGLELLRRLEAGDRAIKACREIANMELEAK